MNEPETTTRAGPTPTPRTHCLAGVRGIGLAGVLWACPAAFLAMLVLHGLYDR